MWKRLLETTKKVAAAAPELATRKRPSTSRGAAVSPATAVSPASLLRLKQAAASKKTIFPSSLPHAVANDGEEEEDNSRDFTKEILSVLNGPDEAEESGVTEALPEESEDNVDAIGNKILDMEWFAGSQPSNAMMHLRKEVAREKKKRYIFKNTESRRFTRLMRMCADKLGMESALEFFGRLGRDTGPKEFNALARVCLEKARACGEIDSAVEHIFRAYRLFEMMKDRGFQIEEDSYGPFLLYLMDVEMLEEFEMFSAFFRDANPRSCSRIPYYEMLLLIRAQDEESIRELCRSVEDCSEEADYCIAECYMLAFAESNRKMDFVTFLKLLDPTKVLGSKYVSSIFKYMGRLELETHAEKLLQKMTSKEYSDVKVSSLIFDYAANIPSLEAEDVISAFNKWREKFKITPSADAYDRIISFCCSSSKTSLALDVAECLCKSNPSVPIELLNPIIHACEQGYELHMARPLYNLMSLYKLKLKPETFRSMISLCVKMKDFEGAYTILTDAEESGETSTVSLYNVIMAGYFREKNHNRAQMVMSQMRIAGVKPDSETFSYLISNCDCEEKISKYLDELRRDGVQMTKHAYMALINAYSRLGNFDMAKQVALDKEIPPKCLSEVRSALVGALASNGKLSDGLELFDEIKQSGGYLEPKAAIALIEHTQAEDQLDRLYQLLEEVSEPGMWFDGCGRVLQYCVQHNHSDAAVDLLKQLKETNEMSTYMIVDQAFCQIWEMEPVNLDIGMVLLRAVKELGLHVSRTSLDFLLSACVKAKDSQRAQQIWEEYESSGLPHNVLSSLRMYQALLSSGQRLAAKKVYKTIPKDDLHVRCILDSCKNTYNSKRGKRSAAIKPSSGKQEV
ncbi:pentatricopeptide repeat-containing protein [Hordeum vulgare]|uniref:Pentacotripeptide-repeat region of PRORP domain-containing protein n=1 Tax=Hordeum vulgare subsp. vulgare TaxID=112509 RepID=A0A8I6YAH7_HORVV|nr:pentatricopeptide repeat-containing protein At4g04790, mitochondrial-like isoform X2 [Hordeum vulgare subsp. vulgare]KAE8779586.1 pentatricopeptide repeat-containing protein [Hordeum vulgare]